MQIREALLTAGGIGLNLVLAKIAVILSLPVYLDSVATIISVVLLPWYLTLTIAIATSVIGAIVVDPHLIAYVSTQLTVALVAIFCFRVGLLNSWLEALLAGIIIAICAVIISAPVTVLLFEGSTWSSSTAVTATLLNTGKNLWQSVMQGAILIELIDKTTASLLACFILKKFPVKRL